MHKQEVRNWEARIAHCDVNAQQTDTMFAQRMAELAGQQGTKGGEARRAGATAQLDGHFPNQVITFPTR